MRRRGGTPAPQAPGTEGQLVGAGAMILGGVCSFVAAFAGWEGPYVPVGILLLLAGATLGYRASGR